MIGVGDQMGATGRGMAKVHFQLAAAILLIITRMPKAAAMPSILDIAEVAMVAEVTVRSTAQMLYPYTVDLMPPDWSSRDATAKIVEALKKNT